MSTSTEVIEMAEIEVFLDTAYAIALSAPGDSRHEEAVSLARWIEASSIRLVTTRAVSLEIGSALAKARYRKGCWYLLLSTAGLWENEARRLEE